MPIQHQTQHKIVEQIKDPNHDSMSLSMECAVFKLLNKAFQKCITFYNEFEHN